MDIPGQPRLVLVNGLYDLVDKFFRQRSITDSRSRFSVGMDIGGLVLVSAGRNNFPGQRGVFGLDFRQNTIWKTETGW